MLGRVKQIQFASFLLCVALSGFSGAVFAVAISKSGSRMFALGMALVTVGGVLETYALFMQYRLGDSSSHPVLHTISRLSVWGALLIFFIMMISARANLARL